MQPAQFVTELVKLVPTIEELRADGLNKREIEEFRRAFRCVKREHPLEFDARSDGLLSLLKGWDASEIEIGMVSFVKRPTKKRNGLLVGYDEADPLLMRSDGEIVVEDHASEGYVMLYAAKDGTRFLDALMLVARFSHACCSGKVDEDDDEAAHTAAKRCASAAGGKKYLQFYLNLIGVV